MVSKNETIMSLNDTIPSHPLYLGGRFFAIIFNMLCNMALHGIPIALPGIGVGGKGIKRQGWIAVNILMHEREIQRTDGRLILSGSDKRDKGNGLFEKGKSSERVGRKASGLRPMQQGIG